MKGTQHPNSNPIARESAARFSSLARGCSRRGPLAGRAFYTATEELAADNARKACARFFIRSGQRGSRFHDEHTLPLFGMPLILEAEGLLAKDASAAYLERCRKVIADVRLDFE